MWKINTARPYATNSYHETRENNENRSRAIGVSQRILNLNGDAIALSSRKS
jgi:hypothetical protein